MNKLKTAKKVIELKGSVGGQQCYNVTGCKNCVLRGETLWTCNAGIPEKNLQKAQAYIDKHKPKVKPLYYVFESRTSVQYIQKYYMRDNRVDMLATVKRLRDSGALSVMVIKGNRVKFPEETT